MPCRSSGKQLILFHPQIRNKEDCKPMSRMVRRKKSTTRRLLSTTKILQLQVDASANRSTRDLASSHHGSAPSIQENTQDSSGYKERISRTHSVFGHNVRSSISKSPDVEDGKVDGVQYRLQSKRVSLQTDLPCQLHLEFH